MQQYEQCQNCLNRKFDRAAGIYCGLTDQKPTFTSNCPDFDLDEKYARRGQDLPDALRRGKSLKKIANRLIGWGATLGITGFVFKNIGRLDSGGYGWFTDLAIVSVFIQYIGIILLIGGVIIRLFYQQDDPGRDIIDDELDSELDDMI